MRKHYCALILGLIPLLFLKYGWERFHIYLTTEIQVPLIETYNAEALIAIGRKFSYNDAGIYELELIPGISDTLAWRLLKKREAILAQSSSGADAAALLQTVRGVGPKTAARILSYLTMEKLETGNFSVVHLSQHQQNREIGN